MLFEYHRRVCKIDLEKKIHWAFNAEKVLKVPPPRNRVITSLIFLLAKEKQVQLS